MTLTDRTKPAREEGGAFQAGFQQLLLGVVQGPFLKEENRLLKNQADTLLAHEETHRQLQKENTRLRELLNFKEKSPWRLIAAGVIGREVTLWSKSLILNKGGRDGVSAGMAVIAAQGLIGRVQEVGVSTARVILLTDPHFRVTAVVSKSRSMGLVVGSPAGECLLTYLPKEGDLTIGETVLSAGGLSFCPEGVPIGTIRRVREDSSQLFRTADLKPAVEVGGADEVLIVASPLGTRE